MNEFVCSVYSNYTSYIVTLVSQNASANNMLFYIYLYTGRNNFQNSDYKTFFVNLKSDSLVNKILLRFTEGVSGTNLQNISVCIFF